MNGTPVLSLVEGKRLNGLNPSKGLTAGVLNSAFGAGLTLNLERLSFKPAMAFERLQRLELLKRMQLIPPRIVMLLAKSEAGDGLV